jgi:hypothetical protein
MKIRRAEIAALASLVLLVTTPALAVTGFIVNSDDPGVRDFDALHRIDLASGTTFKVGEVRGSDSAAPYADVEGLAMSRDGVLFGIDDASKTLLHIDIQSGRAIPVDGRDGNTGLPRTSNFDFGLSFDCSGNLYASSDSRRSLYRLDPLTGAATLVGSEGSLGAQITGLAARFDGLYGIGSSGDENLYLIDTSNGHSSLIGPLGAGLRFTDGGLDFDATGQLWGVADMTGSSINAEPSVLFRIDAATGAATRVSTGLPGIESLAITAPVCDAPDGPVLPPAIPTLDRSGLLILGVLIGLLALLALRSESR